MATSKTTKRVAKAKYFAEVRNLCESVRNKVDGAFDRVRSEPRKGTYSTKLYLNPATAQRVSRMIKRDAQNFTIESVDSNALYLTPAYKVIG